MMRILVFAVLLIAAAIGPALAASPAVTVDGSGRVLARTQTEPQMTSPGADQGFNWVTNLVESPETFTKGLWATVVARGPRLSLGYWVCRNGSPTQSVVHCAFSTDSGATWTIEAVDTSSNYTSGECEMAWFRGGIDLDSAGRPHLAYTVSCPGVGSFGIHAQRLGPNNWQHDTIEMSSNAYLICYDADLKIDSLDRVHVVYPYNGFQTRYAVRDGGVWTIHDIPGDTTVGCELALDSAGNPHVVIGTLGSVCYAYSSDGGESWLVEKAGNSWWHCAIALGENDEPLIAHSVGTMSNANIWLARRIGPGVWTSYQADDSTNNPYRPAITWDPDEGVIHIGYYGGSSVKHAWSSDQGQTWSHENVAAGYMNSTSNVPGFLITEDGMFLPYESPGSGVSMARNLNPSGLHDYLPAHSRTCELALSVAPNPAASSFNPSISYTLPVAGSVSLRLYDVSGKLVSTLVSGFRPAGSYSSRLTANSSQQRLATGIYVLLLDSGSYHATEKLIIE
jgi:hypothetical protein